jgi:glycosyltransferase involved in cell wall biosynthesis
MISLLFVAAELAPWNTNGISNVVQKLGNALAVESGVKLTILGTVPRRTNSPPVGYHPAIEFICVEKPGTVEPLRHLQLQTGYRTAVSAWIRANPTGIVHFHILPGARGFLAAAKALHRPDTVVLTHYDWAPFEIPYYHHRWAHSMNWWLIRVLLPRFPYLVANSRYIADAVHSLYPAAKLTLIPNGISLQEWPTNNSPRPLAGTPSIFHWGMLWEKKGVDILLSAFAILRSHGFLDARLYIGGKGPDAAKLRRIASSLGISEFVSFLGKMDDAALRNFVHGCDIAVFPAAYEGFGIAIMEAMACGKAVVTTARGGPHDFISHGEDGVLVPERNARCLAKSLEDLALQPDLIKRMGQRARQKTQQYDWSRLAPQYTELYKQLVDRISETRSHLAV